jgi:hypothetical protein
LSNQPSHISTKLKSHFSRQESILRLSPSGFVCKGCKARSSAPTRTCTSDPSVRQRKAAARTGESLGSIWLLMREWPRPKGRLTVAVTDIDDAVAVPTASRKIGWFNGRSEQPTG